jgi:hypothetical protein
MGVPKWVDARLDLAESARVELDETEAREYELGKRQHIRRATKEK